MLNSERFVRGTDIQEIFSQLGVDEATHAFYLGKELAKAKLAITLGKTYRQEGRSRGDTSRRPTIRIANTSA